MCPHKDSYSRIIFLYMHHRRSKNSAILWPNFYTKDRVFTGFIKAIIIKKQVKFSTIINLWIVSSHCPQVHTEKYLICEIYKENLELFLNANTIQDLHFYRRNSFLCHVTIKIKTHIVNKTFGPIRHTITCAGGMHNCAANLCMKCL